ncbi:SH3 domain-containing protein [Campylobacter fetus]|uniref:SH3 domain-containing protein n=1 Tax=Campylobacter TaxID=194 RepID=UPI0008187FF8|nr:MULTISPECIES: SH3 domain-containing protein [Campylobacter]EAH8299367.1 SH3 domain-containing protein [Campylobacter fetus]EAI7231964.1 SH3 domain-containing protein [Campylobacter fetus]EAJ5689928.1 SH3 domain-containing protein [Campylobacter fetus]EAK0427472.1 SH3 domain-containing protein [Campylobacter fetus]EAK5305243.1 SH3 domain-containing protein [Campylobacter fetus]
MLKYILLLFLPFYTTSVAQEVSIFDMIDGKTTQNKENTIKNNQQQNTILQQNAKKQILPSEIQKIAPTDEPDENIDSAQIYQTIEPNKLILTASKMPRSVYIYQVFSIKLKADTEQNLNFDLNLTVDSNDLIWLNPKPNWSELKRGIYETTLWFEANSTNANISNITLTLNRNDSFFQKSSISTEIPLIKNLKTDDKFANMVADKLEIKKVKSSKFDELYNLITIELESKNGNLSSFFIPQNFEKQGIESIKGDFVNQNGNYFIIADKDIKNINFSYYNLKSSKFESFDIDIKVEVDDLSTQVNLNPKESEFELYKDIALYFIIVIFLLLFIFKRSYYSFIIAIAFGIYTFYDNRPFSDAKLKINSEVKILPTSNSTIFFVANRPEKVKIMAKNGNYTKILLENKKIGWVSNENIE